jgi:hypothetical protein
MMKAWAYAWDLFHLLNDGSKHLMLVGGEGERHPDVIC